MEYNLNEDYDKDDIIQCIKNYLNNFANVDITFKKFSKEERDMIKYHHLTGLSSYLISCCYTFIKDNENFKISVKERFESLQNECDKLEIKNDLKCELVDGFRNILNMIKIME